MADRASDQVAIQVLNITPQLCSNHKVYVMTDDYVTMKSVACEAPGCAIDHVSFEAFKDYQQWESISMIRQ